MKVPKIAVITLPSGDPLWDGIPLEKLIAAFISGVQEYGSEEIDYFVTSSNYWKDMVASSQCFFEEQINIELKRVGLKTQVKGQAGGHSRHLCDRIRLEFPNFSDDGIYAYYGALADCCLYRVVN